MRPRHLLLVLAAATALVAAGCKSRPNVVLVTFDTVRGDAPGFASGRKDVSPHLDALAARGVRFDYAIASQPLTLPSHATIMTGLYPPHHGIRNNGTYVLADAQVTLAERLRDAGYDTHAIVASFVLDSQFGLDQGFAAYDDDLSGGPRQKMFMFKEIQAKTVADKAIAWLRGRGAEQRPFFLWLHFFDPHADYQPPQDVAIKFPGEPYLGEIHYADRELGRVFETLDALGLGDDTVIAFTSDHGESLGEHGERTHGIFVYDATVRVPLVIAGPGVPKGTRVTGPVRTADIAPTLLELTRVKGSAVDGSSLEPLFEGDSSAPPRTAYTESLSPLLNFGWAALRGLRSTDWKIIDSPRPEAYALKEDPRETRNLWRGAPPDAARRLAAELAGIRRADPFERGEQRADRIDPELQRRLAALGYVWSTPRASEDRARADAKDRIAYWEAFQTAQVQIRGGSFGPAIQAIERLLAVDPDNVIAMGSLATALSRLGEDARAEPIYGRMIEIDPQRDAAYLGLARIARSRGAFEDAERHARRLLELQPKNVEGYLSLGDTALEKQQWAEAEGSFRKALAIDPHSSLAIAGLGNTFNRAGRLQDSLRILREGREKDPTSYVLTYNLAVVTERLGDTPAARALYEEAIRIDPEQSMAWNNLGSLMSRSGRPQEAIKMIARAYQVDPSNVEAAYNLGALLLTHDRPAEALPYLEAALRINRSFAPAAAMRARALMRLGRDEEALGAWKALAPGMPAAWLGVAEIEMRRGHRDAARSALRQGIEAGGERFEAAARRNERLKALL